MLPAVKVEAVDGSGEGIQRNLMALSSASSASEGSGYALTSPVTSSPADASIFSSRRKSGPVRRAKGGWTPEEDETLRKAVDIYNGKNWKKIAQSCPDRTEVQCLHRWQKVLNPELIKGPWTQEEDDVIINMVKKHGPKKWSVIARSLNGRIGKQCRERWHNHLDPQIRKEAWTVEEERVLARAHCMYGNKWAEIAKLLPGSTSNILRVQLPAIGDDLKPSAENHIDLNKEPIIYSRDCQGLVDHSDPTSDQQAMKMDSVHGETTGNNFLCGKVQRINLVVENGFQTDQISDKMGCSRLAKREGEAVINGGESSLQSEAHSVGFLCYENPKNEDTVPAQSPMFSAHYVPEHSRDEVHSPNGYTTPSPTSRKGSDQLSVDSILRSAAENFREMTSNELKWVRPVASKVTVPEAK
uniref:Uncharacterized protein n=1 Tax=Leersia perrieri TaxID=77586 RepID=A0A0D9WHB0_9ORYZ